MASETTLRPGEIKDILLREIQAADLHELDVEEVGTVLEVKDGIARIYGLSKAMSGEMLEVTATETGNKITALALNLEEDNIGAVILGDYLQLKEFTYWLFKYRVRSLEGARVASDTRKGLAALSRVEAAYRKRNRLDVSEPEPEVAQEEPMQPTPAELSRERVRARRARAAHFGDVNAF